MDSSIPSQATPMDEAQPIDPSELGTFITDVNIAKHLTDEELTTIGYDCKQGFESDHQSRSEWEECIDEWTKLAMQHRETKNYPWPNASNIKYPILSTASMQFNARAYPSLVPADGKVVKGKVVGKDPEGTEGDKADRVATYMSWQFMHEMECWDEDMDRLLMMLPILGTMFKKTYWCADDKMIKSELVLPKNLVVNNWAQSIEKAERVSEIIEMSERVLLERQRSKSFLDVDLGQPVAESRDEHNNNPRVDETTPYILIEQHTFLDLDHDGYKEPYIVTFHKHTGKVLRIFARFEEDGIQFSDGSGSQSDDGSQGSGKQVVKITPVQYYTKYSFVPNPNGSFYDIGFGVLLGPINEAVNSVINQLVDAGTLSNMQSGFIGKGLRIKVGDARFQPGEWKPVASTGQDLKSQIVPLPAKEPSNVLFELMGSLITSGKELASVAEIFVGKMPGQNTPATTTMATIEQGMKVFTAVYKRVYRAMDKEFKKVYKLNGVYLEKDTANVLSGGTMQPEDFQQDYNICPGADPTAMSSTEKLMKAQGLMEMLPNFGPMMNPVEVLERILIAQDQPNWQKLVSAQVLQTGQPPPPQPDPKVQAIQAKAQTDQQKVQLDAQMMQFKAQLEQRDQQFQQQMEGQKQAQEMQFQQVMAAIKAHGLEMEARAKVASTIMQAHAQAQVHEQSMTQNAEMHKEKLTQARQISASQQKTSGPGGSKK